MGQAKELLGQIELDEQENFSKETIQKFESDEKFYRDFVKKVEVDANNTFPVVGRAMSPRDTLEMLLNIDF
jgi:hypothetical protein